MPTFTAIALETLLEPNTTRDPSSKKKPSSPPNQQQHQQDQNGSNLNGNSINSNSSNSSNSSNNSNNSNNNNNNHERAATAKKHSSQTYRISPALYATPDPAPIPQCSPTSVSPSPYVVNHKRRDNIRPAASSEALNRLDGFEIQRKPDQECPGNQMVEEGRGGGREEEGRAEEGEGVLDLDGLLDEGESGLEKAEPVEGEDDDFFDPRDSMSVASSSDMEDGGSLRHGGFGNHTPLRNPSEFYDATEDFLSDGCTSQSSPSFSTNIVTELHSLRLNLFEESARRKKAEEALGHMHNQWQRIAKCLSQAGLSFPDIQHAENMELEIDPAAVCQEVVVARFVSEAVGRGLARAETEAVAEAVIDSKNHEITRLRDRLQYYEAMNREMSQRNQEVMELARQRHLWRRRRRTWMWSCIGLSITVGASWLAYSYLPQPGKNPSPISDQRPDATSGKAESR